MQSTLRARNSVQDLDKEDEIPRPNLNPEKHGYYVWLTWNHLASQANTPRRREKLRYWVENILVDMFGCGMCRSHLPQHLKKFPIQNYMASAEQMLLHAFLVHDSATRSIPGKDLSNLPTFQDIKKIYFPSKEASCSTVCTGPEDEEDSGDEGHKVPVVTKQVTRKPVINNMSQKRGTSASMSKKVSPTRTLAPQISDDEDDNIPIRTTRFVRKGN